MAVRTLYSKEWSNMTSSELGYFTALCQNILQTKSIKHDVYELYQTLLGENKDQFASQRAFVQACVSRMNVFDVLGALGQKLYAYHSKSSEYLCEIFAVISQSNKNPGSMIVLEGKITGHTAPLAVKWYKGDSFDIRHEMSLYSRIAARDRTVLPWFSTSYRLWTDPVLVVRAKKVLSNDEDEFAVGRSILNKLRIIHLECIHCDIKIDNIVKDDGENPNYYLIDYGQSTPIEDRKGDWHIRYVHTKKYMREGFERRTSVKTDLLELLHTMRRMQLLKQNKKGSCTTGFSGPLKKYHNLVQRANEYPNETIYDELIACLVE